MKIGIVNDSIMATEILRRIVVSCPEHKLLWTAENGAEAIMHCNHHLPDLILMDLMMPVMDGIEATRRIMKQTPCPILIVTGSVTGNSSMVFEAMGVGALDVVATPVLAPNQADSSANELIRKIQIIGKLTGVDRKEKSSTNKTVPPRQTIKESTLIAIGASTGGPQALATVLSCLPINFPASVVVVQHMDQKFTSGLADWLNQQISLPVKIIINGERPQKSTVKIPSTDNHLIMSKTGTLNYSVDPVDNFYHPSVDVFFQSLNANWCGNIIGVILTGMGKDGAKGLLDIKENGHYTIAQDEETSVVYGMPKAAQLNGSAQEILPLEEIGPRLLALVKP
nr:chemotaxis response regulator protein-glutamate methylesterase [Desulfobulbaceae bacterium]